MSIQKATKSDCAGCRQDYYNYGNASNTGECWLLKDAKVVLLWAIGWWTPMDKKENFHKVRKPECYTQTGKVLYCKNLPEHLREAK